MFAAALIAILSACSTTPDQQCPTAERAVEYIEKRVPDALLVSCRPRVLQAEVNPSGRPETAVVIIRSNNGILDECSLIHESLINHILGHVLMPGDSKPDLKVKKPKHTPTPESKKIKK